MNRLRPEFHVHFMDCGQGNMQLLVMPDMSVVVYDCRITEEDEERILAHLNAYIPLRADSDGRQRRWIDWFILSHRDQDHFLGLDRLNRRFRIRGIVDPGTTSGSVDGDAYQYYMQLRRDILAAHGPGRVVVPEPSERPLLELGGVTFHCLCSGSNDSRVDDGHYGNNVFQVGYAGNRVLLAGDSDWASWKEKIVPRFGRTGLLRTTVLLASHHGSRSFFVDSDPNLDETEAWKSAYVSHLPLVAPSLTVVSVGDQETHNHPNERALQLYKSHTRNEQVYLTRDKGTLVGRFFSDGRWTVTPARFLRGWCYRAFGPAGKELRVRCERKSLFGDSVVRSGEQVPLGSKLRFTAIAEPGLFRNPSEVKYEFEVSNGGEGKDAARDEIYFKGPNESAPANGFERDVVYQGTHLLRVRVHGPGVVGEAQEVFEVRSAP